MKTKIVISTLAALALSGSVYASEGFETLHGIPAEAMSSVQMEQVQGKDLNYNWAAQNFAASMREHGSLISPWAHNKVGLLVGTVFAWKVSFISLLGSAFHHNQVTAID